MANFLGTSRKTATPKPAAPTYTPEQIAARRKAAGITMPVANPQRPPVVVASRQGGLVPQAAPTAGVYPAGQAPAEVTSPTLLPPMSQGDRQAFAGINPADVVNGPPETPPPPTDPLQAFLDMLPQEGDYVGPYDQQLAATKSAYDASTPQINAIYGDLVKQLQAGSADYAKTQGADRQALASQLGQLQATQQQAGTAGLDSLKNQGVDVQSLLDRFQGDAAQGAASLGQSTQDQLGLMDRLAQVRQQSDESRVSDAGLAKSNSLANAQQSMLDQTAEIGKGKADAQRQFKQDDLKGKLDIQDMRLKLQEAQTKQIDSLTKQYKTTASKQFVQQEMPGILAKYPAGSAMLEHIQKLFGNKGEMSRAKATQYLVDHADELANRKYVMEDAHGDAGIAKLEAKKTPYTKVVTTTGKDGKPYGQLVLNRNMNVNKLGEWITQLYDDTQVLPPEIQAQVDALTARG